MLCTVWFDLPKSLVSLCQDIINEKDKKYALLLSSNALNVQEKLNDINKIYDELKPSLNEKESLAIKEKYISIKKERIELNCKCIKLSIKLISDFVHFLQSKENSKTKDILFQVKLLMNILRIVITKSKEEIDKTSNKKEKRFFNLILAYAKKSQNKVYELSNEIVLRVMNTITKENTIKNIINIPEKEIITN